MTQENITIPHNTLYEMLKFQPESVLIDLFDNLFVSYDMRELSDEERVEIEIAKKELLNNETIQWIK